MRAQAILAIPKVIELIRKKIKIENFQKKYESYNLENMNKNSFL